MRAAAPITQPRLSIALGLLLGLSVGSAAAEVVVVVSKNSPVTALTREQVVDIFLGKASRFPDGTRAVPIGASSRPSWGMSAASARMRRE